MAFFKVSSFEAELVSAFPINVEVDISNGLNSIQIVGLPDKATSEARERVSSAIKYSGFKSPKQKNQKVVFSLSPADRKKSGAGFDLAMAVAYLGACREITKPISDVAFVGELSLDGQMRPVPGIMQIIHIAEGAGFKEIYIPYSNRHETAFASKIKIYAVHNLREVVSHVSGKIKISPLENDSIPPNKTKNTSVDLSEIKGQEIAKRALIISASGKHNIALWGPPGTGKSMLARAFASILPNLTREQIIETTSIYSALQKLDGQVINQPPIRAPHHTSSYSSIVGGGSRNRAGEITLAHNGVLFLDEFPEFDRRTINSLRQPLEDKKIFVSRSKEVISYPADFLLIVAMNPCPCGYRETKIKNCSCTPNRLLEYRQKISGPIIDRMDLWVEVGHIDKHELMNGENSCKVSPSIQKIVYACREIQIQRQGVLNGDIKENNIKIFNIDEEAQKIIKIAVDKHALSPRSFFRILKVARTIADLEKSQQIKKPHILEALQFRHKD